MEGPFLAGKISPTKYKVVKVFPGSNQIRLVVCNEMITCWS